MVEPDSGGEPAEGGDGGGLREFLISNGAVSPGSALDAVQIKVRGGFKSSSRSIAQRLSRCDDICSVESSPRRYYVDLDLTDESNWGSAPCISCDLWRARECEPGVCAELGEWVAA